MTNLDVGMKSLQPGEKSLQPGDGQTGWKVAHVHESFQTVLMGTLHQSCWDTPGRAAATG